MMNEGEPRFIDMFEAHMNLKISRTQEATPYAAILAEGALEFHREYLRPLKYNGVDIPIPSAGDLLLTYLTRQVQIK